MPAAEVARLKQLEDENRQRNQMVAGLSLDKQLRQEVLRKQAEARRDPAITLRSPTHGHLPNEHYWSIDCLADQLVTGHRFRIFTAVDPFNRECVGRVADEQRPLETRIDVIALPQAALGRTRTTTRGGRRRMRSHPGSSRVIHARGQELLELDGGASTSQSGCGLPRASVPPRRRLLYTASAA